MVKIQSTSENGPEYKTGEYKPTSYQYTQHKSGPYKDTIRHQEYKQSELKAPTQQKLEYRSYEPTHVGLWGDKPREKKPTARKATPVQRRIRRPRKTFECYSNPRGPDISLGDAGPEYPVKNYEYTPYKPHQLDTSRPRSGYKDPLKGRLLYVPQQYNIYEGGSFAYKINEENDAGLRHWRHDGIDDTVAAYRTDGNEKKYKVEKKPKEEKKPKDEKPKEEEPVKKIEESKPVEKVQEKPVMAAAVIPVHRAVSPPKKKEFKSSSTQHVGPGVKTGATQTQATKMTTTQTQYEPVKTKTLGTQSEHSKTQHVSIQTTPVPDNLPPVVAPLVMSEAPKKVKTKSEGIQCTEERTKVVVRGTQYDPPRLKSMNTQTSPLPVPIVPAPVPIQARERTPQYVEEVREETPVYQRPPSRRSPSPTIVPIVAPIPIRRSPSPRKQSPVKKARSPSPQQRPPSHRRSPSPRRTPSPTIVPIVAPVPTRRSPTPRKQSPVRNVPSPSPSPKSTNDKPRTPPMKTPASDSRWTPSPEVSENVPEVASAAPPPQRAVPMTPPRQYEPSPFPQAVDKKPEVASAAPPPPKIQHSVPDSNSAKLDTPKPNVAGKTSPIKQSTSGRGPFPYPSTRSRLPPEVKACIEAYDCVHG